MKLILFWLSLVLCIDAFAQALPADVPRVNFPMISVGNVTKVGAMTADASNAAKFSYGAAANGSIFAYGGGSLPTAGGSSIPLGVNSSIPVPAAVAAIGRFMGKVLPVLSTGVALYDLARELGFNVSNNPDGTMKVDKTSTGYTYRASAYGRDLTGTSPSSVCSGFNGLTWGSASQYGGLYKATSSSFGGADVNGDGVCNVPYNSTWGPNYSGSLSISVSRDRGLPVTTTQPSTVQELINAIPPVTPATSALPRVLSDALKSGESVQIVPETVTGPASSPGPSTVTKDAINNTTTTTTTTNNYQYAGDTVTTTQVTNSTTINNTTGAVTAQTSTTTTPNSPSPVDSASDTPLGDLPVLYKPKYPNGLTGVWSDQKSALMGTPLLSLTSSMMPTITGSGAYPSFPVSVVIGPWDFGTYDVSPPPLVWDFLKVCVIVSALFLARALIFGG